MLQTHQNLIIHNLRKLPQCTRNVSDQCLNSGTPFFPRYPRCSFNRSFIFRKDKWRKVISDNSRNDLQSITRLILNQIDLPAHQPIPHPPPTQYLPITHCRKAAISYIDTIATYVRRTFQYHDLTIF